MKESFTEATLFKVFKALRKIGLDEEQATNAITEMQNDGILFREKPLESNAAFQPIYRGATS